MFCFKHAFISILSQGMALIRVDAYWKHTTYKSAESLPPFADLTGSSHQPVSVTTEIHQEQPAFFFHLQLYFHWIRKSAFST